LLVAELPYLDLGDNLASLKKGIAVRLAQPDPTPASLTIRVIITPAKLLITLQAALNYDLGYANEFGCTNPDSAISGDQLPADVQQTADHLTRRKQINCQLW
jgi:hypothetical protein